MSGSIGEEGSLMSTGLSFGMSLSVVGVVKGSNSRSGGPNMDKESAGIWVYIFALRCASQKTDGHARIAHVTFRVQFS